MLIKAPNSVFMNIPRLRVALKLIALSRCISTISLYFTELRVYGDKKRLIVSRQLGDHDLQRIR